MDSSLKLPMGNNGAKPGEMKIGISEDGQVLMQVPLPNASPGAPTLGVLVMSPLQARDLAMALLEQSIKGGIVASQKRPEHPNI